jgi:hypothetical protein
MESEVENCNEGVFEEIFGGKIVKILLNFVSNFFM